MRLETEAAGDGQEPKQEAHTWENHPMRESKTRRKLGAAKIQAGSVEHTHAENKIWQHQINERNHYGRENFLRAGNSILEAVSRA
jgi:hypothetical protein